MNESSREKLDMDLDEIRCNSRKKVKQSTPNDLASQLTFDHHKGYYIRRWILLLLLLLFICALLAVGLLTAYLKPCERTADHRSATQSDECVKCRKKVFSRLPTSVIPLHYAVELQPYIQPNHFYFDGNVSILVECREETDNITLHVNDITIFNETVELIVNYSQRQQQQSNEQQQIEIVSLAHDFDRQFFIINFNQKLRPQSHYWLSMAFKGNLNNELAGFYRSTYEDPTDGKQRWMAVTQFQPTDARRAFPCFDEPALKATFSITITHYANMTALSNMPIESTEKSDEWIIDRFQRTVNMSTYLLAFVVGDIDALSNSNFSVWCRKSAIKTAKYALEIGPKVLKHYANFFNIPFPLPKMDMVAVPDFNAGAMENWGLIVYRETAMLFDEKVSSVFNRQSVATVVAHELAHQWFGNLVTPKWWDDLWLNEGFASYMEYEGVDSVHPNWKMFDQFVVDEIHSVFELDSLASSHPISVKVGHPEEINEIFDKISYGKGAVIIRMIIHILGSDTFKLGVSNYLNALKFSNAEQDDLWRYLTDARRQNSSGDDSVDVKKIMDSWTLQTGYPLVTLTRSYNDNTATLSQKRFFIASNNETQNDTTKWEIPITFTTAKEPNWKPDVRIWLRQNQSSKEKEEEKDEEIEIPQNDIPSANEWMLLNVQQVGYYRVNYDVTNWNLIVNQLITNHSVIHLINRAQILDDLMDLSRSGIVEYSLALQATSYLHKETEFIPWDAALSSFYFLQKMLRRSPVFGSWKRYVLKLIVPLYEKIGWQKPSNDDVLKQSIQVTALSWACDYGHQHCVNFSRTLFEEWKDAASNGKENPISPYLRPIVYCTSIANGNENDWKFVWKQYKSSKVAAESDRLLKALACSREPWILNRYLDWSFNESSRIRKQDGSSVFRSIATSNYGRDLAFNYIRDQWDKVVEYYGKTFFSFGSLIKSIASSFNTRFELKQLKEFYEMTRHNVGTAERSFRQAIERTEANVEWMHNYYEIIENWIEEHTK